jgi:hypothetical protein
MHNLSGFAAVETAGEEIAAAPADGRDPIGTRPACAEAFAGRCASTVSINSGRRNMPLAEIADKVQADGAGRSIYPPR